MRVPNTNTFTLKNVYDSVQSHTVDATVGNSLSACFNMSWDTAFDPLYGSKTMSPRKLSGFRNYSPNLLGGIVTFTNVNVGNNLPWYILTAKEKTAQFFGEITYYGNINYIPAFGFCVNSTGNPTEFDTVIYCDPAQLHQDPSYPTRYTFYKEYYNSSWVEGTSYYVRAFITIDSFTSYGVNIRFVPNNYYSGRSFEGGKIVTAAYQPGSTVISDGLVTSQWAGIPKLLIAADVNLGPETWANDGNLGTSSSGGSSFYDTISEGVNNTTRIIFSDSNQNLVAWQCYNLILNGYNDWYLPSILELHKCYDMGFLTSPNIYWSSSESGSANAWMVGASDGVGAARDRGNYFYAKPCRYKSF